MFTACVGNVYGEDLELYATVISRVEVYLAVLSRIGFIREIGEISEDVFMASS